MGDPTTKTATFNGSLDGFTGVDPIRYLSGLWLEEATTNQHSNPRPTTIANGGSAVNSAVISRDTSVAYPGDVASWKVVCPGSIANEGGLFGVSGQSITSGNAWSAQGVVFGPAGQVVRHWFRIVYTDSSVAETSVLTTTLDGTWQEIKRLNLATNGSKTIRDMLLMVRNNTAAAFTFYVSRVQFEEKSYATSLAAGDMGSGYGHSGTAYNSPSTRAASSASISPSGILTSSSGALAFRITPTIETGVEEIWGECGVKGSGTDHVRWGRDSSKHPFVEWSANNAAYQRLTGSETLNALTAYDLYLGHSATTISLAVDAGTLQTGTRDAISDSWGAGDLTLKATAGGVVYNQFATFNRPLSASEIKTLDRRNSWSRTMFGNPFAYFQLRPY